MIKNLYNYITDENNIFNKNIFNKKSNINTSSNNPNKIKDIVITLNISLKDLFSSYKKLVIKVLRREYINGKLTLIKKKEDFYISLINYQNEYFFKEKGDEDLLSNRGNVKILINILKGDYELDVYNVIYNLDISIYEYLYGINRDIHYLDDAIIKLNQQFYGELVDKIYYDRGIKYYDNERDICKYGNLIIKFRLNFSIKNVEYLDDDLFKSLAFKYLS